MNNNNILTLSCKWYINTFKNLPIIVFILCFVDVLQNFQVLFKYLYYIQGGLKKKLLGFLTFFWIFKYGLFSSIQQ